MSERLNGRILRDRQIGEPVFKETRVTPRTVLASLADGDTAEKILADFPSLTREGIQAAIAFAAASAEEDLLESTSRQKQLSRLVRAESQFRLMRTDFCHKGNLRRPAKGPRREARLKKRGWPMWIVEPAAESQLMLPKDLW